MVAELEGDLIDAVREGRAALFLGSGASRGALSTNGGPIPDGTELARLVAAKFLGPEYANDDLKTVYDLACSVRNIRAVQEFIHTTFVPFEPADFHKLIPRFVWAGLLTTNYDLIVERAYEAMNQDRLQEIIPFVCDGESATEKLTHGRTLYVKLHGCISRYQIVDPPLIASTEQLIRHKEGRVGQFDTFLELAKTKTIIFVGYSFLDQNLRSLFDEVVREGDARPRHYLINPGLRSLEKDYWAERRVRPISIDFSTFITDLDTAIPEVTRKLALVSAPYSTTSFSKFMTVSGRAESAHLHNYLSGDCEHVSPDLDVPEVDPKRFYCGFDTGWRGIQEGLDVSRATVKAILKDQVIGPQPGSGPKFIVVKAHAGAGKSVALRRLAWDSAKQYDKLALFVDRSGRLDVSALSEVHSLTNLPVFLFVDGVTSNIKELKVLLDRAKAKRWPLIVIASERVNEWNVFCQDLEALVDEDYEIRYLSEREIEDLVALLDLYDCLGYLKDMRPEQRLHELREIHGRQLLVALHEATHGMPLRQIVKNEYEQIPTDEARVLYLDICALHRYGPPVRAGLISRVHDISFEDFKTRFFAPLENVVEQRFDPRSGDQVYQARHAQIADIVFTEIVKTEEEKFDFVLRIIRKLNPAFSYDEAVIVQLVRAENIDKDFPDRRRADAIYDAALASVGRHIGVLHQRGIFEMRRATQRRDLEAAESYLHQALELSPGNRAFLHSLAELSLKRSRLATDELERDTWRSRAIEQARTLGSGSTHSYPHHTMLKAAVDGVKDSLAKAETSDTELGHEALGHAIKRAEDILQSGRRLFPNDSHLLNEEAEFHRILLRADKALAALEKAFRARPQSELIVRRLAMIYLAKGDAKAAVETLRKGLEFNQSSQGLHFQFAMATRELTPNADIEQCDTLLYHLQRSFVANDRNYSARFWYARQLCIGDRFQDAKVIFEELKNLRIGREQKTRVRGVLRDEHGDNARFAGQIVVLREVFGFIRCDSLNIDAYFSLFEMGAAAQTVALHDRVSFEIGFTLLSPMAQNVQRLLL